MKAHAEIVIAGGGIIGLTTAWFLARTGARVTVIERGDFGAEASWAGAGIIPPGNLEHAATPDDQLRARSSAAFTTLSAKLQELTGIDNGYRVCGGVEYLAGDHEDTLAAWKQEQIAFELVQPPGFHSNESAYLLPGMAQVRNPRHVRAVLAACRHAGVALHDQATISGFDRTGNYITAAILTNGDRIAGGRFLIAAGAWSEHLLRPFGIACGIHPVRGQMVLLKTPEPVFQRILLADKCYLVPREDGHVLVGSTEEPEAGFVKATTPEAIDGLLDFAVSLVPALAGARMVSSWAGLRPGSADGRPSLGRVGDIGNLYLAAGHFRAGIQLSPATAEIMSDLLLDREPAIDLADFRPGRKPGPFVRPAFHS